MSKYTQCLKDIGGLANMSKMPCHSWSLPAYRCQTGSRLAKVKGTICSQCYARKGSYTFPNTIKAMEQRYSLLDAALKDEDAGLKFVRGFVIVLDYKYNQTMKRTVKSQPIRRDGRYFRWFDSGDLQSVGHLALICEIAQRTPHVKHWLPTREPLIVKEHSCWMGELPPNLTIRVSSDYIDTTLCNSFYPTSTVCTTVSQCGECPAPRQGGKCQSCRLCWGKTHDVSYKLH